MLDKIKTREFKKELLSYHGNKQIFIITWLINSFTTVKKKANLILCGYKINPFLTKNIHEVIKKNIYLFTNLR